MKDATPTQCLQGHRFVLSAHRGTSKTQKADDYLAAAFAQNLAHARLRAGMKSYVAAHALGVSKSTWSQWESCKRLPSITMLGAIAESLNISPCELLRNKGAVCCLISEVHDS